MMSAERGSLPGRVWCALVGAAAFLAGSVAMADAAQPIQWREAFVTTESEVAPVEGHDGHYVGMSQQRGFAFHEDGDVATVNVSLTFERSGPRTRYRGYAVYRFADGSTKVGYFTGRGDPVGAQEGEFRFEGGTGRFAGIRGEGSFSGHAFPPQGDIYLDVEGVYSLSQ